MAPGTCPSCGHAPHTGDCPVVNSITRTTWGVEATVQEPCPCDYHKRPAEEKARAAA